MIVLDACIVVDFLLDIVPFNRQITARIEAEAHQLAVPHLLDIEVTQVLRRFVLRGTITHKRASGAIEDLSDLPVVRYPHTPMLSRIFQLRDNLTAYDATYVALAEYLGAGLLTKDAAFKSIPGSAVAIELLTRESAGR
jgi:predicted nucleic acid-binding protein